MQKSSSGWINNLVVAGTATLLCLVAAEVALRLIAPVQTFVNPLQSFHQFDPELGWTGAPNLKAKFRKVDFNVLVRSDATGFRARESRLQPAPGSRLVAVFGDSFTWGWGVANGQVFTDVMQNELGAGADVRNFGVNAYGTFQELLLLQRLLHQGVRPQDVIVMFFSNDFYDNINTADTRRPSLQVSGHQATVFNQPVARRAVSPWKKLAKRSHLLASIIYVADFTKAKRSVKALEELTFVDGGVAEAPRVALAYCLEQFTQVCRTAGINLWFVYVPSFGEVQVATTSQTKIALQSLCDAQGIRLVDLTSDFRQAAGNQPLAYYFPHDAHWNAAGHEFVGKVLADALKTAREQRD